MGNETAGRFRTVPVNGAPHLSLSFMFVSVTGSYWNLIRWRWRTGGKYTNTTPFLASCKYGHKTMKYYHAKPSSGSVAQTLALLL